MGPGIGDKTVSGSGQQHQLLEKQPRKRPAGGAPLAQELSVVTAGGLLLTACRRPAGVWMFPFKKFSLKGRRSGRVRIAKDEVQPLCSTRCWFPLL